MLTKEAKTRNKRSENSHLTFSGSSSSHKCKGETHQHRQIKHSGHRSQTSTVSRGHRRSTVQSPCRVRWTDWWVTLLLRRLFIKVRRELFSHLPVERAAVEVMISLTFWKETRSLINCREAVEGKNTQNHVFTHLMFTLYIITDYIHYAYIPFWKH